VQGIFKERRMGPENRDEWLATMWNRLEDDFSDEFDEDQPEDDCEAGKEGDAK
jgi:hypothetical protein